MADDGATEEPDRVDDLPHPRETRALYGQSGAEGEFLAAWSAGRLHHAWLLSGPRGVGKATLAYRIARKRIATPGADAPPDLRVDDDDQVFRRIAAGSEPRLAVLRRTLDDRTKKLSKDIRVADMRALKKHFQLSAADGGWRVAIVDSADEMNLSAANALLKILEEPPDRCLFLLVSHAPSRLLPTIRSRCRPLHLKPLASDDLTAALRDAGLSPDGHSDQLSVLSGGSAGEAARLAMGDGVALFSRLVHLVGGGADLDRTAMISMAEACAGRNAAERFDMTLRLIGVLIARLGRAGALGPAADFTSAQEQAIHLRLAPDAAAARIWADLAATVDDKTRRARAVNLDPAGVILDTFLDIDAAVRKVRARTA